MPPPKFELQTTSRKMTPVADGTEIEGGKWTLPLGKFSSGSVRRQPYNRRMKDSICHSKKFIVNLTLLFGERILRSVVAKENAKKVQKMRWNKTKRWKRKRRGYGNSCEQVKVGSKESEGEIRHTTIVRVPDIL